MRRAHVFVLFPFAIAIGSSCKGKESTPVTIAACTDFEHADATCPSMCSPLNDAFCAADADVITCGSVPPGAVLDVCGVPLKQPPKVGTTLQELKRSANVDEYAGTGPVDLSCLEPAGYPAPADPGASQLVTVQGIAKIFSHGCMSKNVDIAIYKVKRTGGADDGDLGDLVGTAVTTSANCGPAAPPDNGDGTGIGIANDECGTRWQCPFTYANVPTETELVVVTGGGTWSNLYDYGVFFSNADVVASAVTHDVRALDSSDYNSIAQVALGSTLTPGKGAIAGEVHDCGDVRISNAIVDIDQPKKVLTYFSDNEAHPLPVLDTKATSTLGLYAAMDVAPGPVAVATAGVADGKLQALGLFRVRVFADSVTTFTFRGLKPFQVP